MSASESVPATQNCLLTKSPASGPLTLHSIASEEGLVFILRASWSYTNIILMMQITRVKKSSLSGEEEAHSGCRGGEPLSQEMG